MQRRQISFELVRSPRSLLVGQRRGLQSRRSLGRVSYREDVQEESPSKRLDTDPMSERAVAGFLTLADVIRSMGARREPHIGLDDVHLIRHSFSSSDPGGLPGLEDVTPERIRRYTRYQDISTKRFPADPARYWVVLIADGQRRSRLYCTYENRGEVVSERTATNRFWDLQPADFLMSLAGRMVVEWDIPRVWHRRGTAATKMPVIEIADRDRVPFPGFDSVLLSYQALVEMLSEHQRYRDWHVALAEVQGIYLITDSLSGHHYVGKATGTERILGRWRNYAHDGHGGNRALRELLSSVGSDGASAEGADRARHFVFSLLRVFGPSTAPSVVDDAETHYKKALLTRDFGLNRN